MATVGIKGLRSLTMTTDNLHQVQYTSCWMGKQTACHSLRFSYIKYTTLTSRTQSVPAGSWERAAETWDEYVDWHRACRSIAHSNTGCLHSTPAPVDITAPSSLSEVDPTSHNASHGNTDTKWRRTLKQTKKWERNLKELLQAFAKFLVTTYVEKKLIKRIFSRHFRAAATATANDTASMFCLTPQNHLHSIMPGSY